MFIQKQSGFIRNCPKLKTMLTPLNGRLNDWINELWCVHTMEYNAARKRKKLLTHMTESQMHYGE